MKSVSALRYRRLVSALAISVAPAAWAANQTWDGGSGSAGSSWLDVLNWNGDSAYAGVTGNVTTNKDIASFGASGTANPVSIDMTGLTGATFSLGAIDWNRTATGGSILTNGSSLTGNLGTLRLNGATVNGVANTLIRVTGEKDLTIQNGSSAFGVALGIANGIFSVDTARTLTISSNVSSSSTVGNGFTKTGAGAMILSGINTYSGNTTISAGTLSISGAGRLGLGFYSGAISIAGGSTFSYNSSANQTLSGVISGSGSFFKVGSGVLTLTGNNSFTGGTTLNGGILDFANNSLGTSGNITFNDNSTLRWATGNGQDISARIAPIGSNVTATFEILSNSLTLASSLSGQGGITKSGANPLTLSGNNTYTGNTTIAQGSLTISGTGLLGGGTYDGSISNNGSFTFGSSSNQTLSGVMSGAGTFTKSGASVLTLTAANTYSGNITISSGGPLALSGNGTLGASGIFTGTINNGGALIFASTANQTLAGALSGVGVLTKSGPGTLTLTANNFYTGNIIISDGILSIDGVGRLGGGTLIGTVSNNSTLAFSSSANQTISGIISGSGVLTKAGSGALTLTGNNTYTGNTTLSAGTLEFANNSLGPSGTINLAGNSTLRWQSGNTQDVSARFSSIGSGNTVTFDTLSNNITLATALSGQGGIGKAGNGTLTLTGNNSYSGSTTIAAGTLEFANDSLTSTSSIAFTGNSTLRWGTGNTQDISALITPIGANLTATLDTNGNNAALSSALTGAGSLAKSGSGTLSLSGNNSYSGGTRLNAGTLEFSSGALGTSGNISFTGSSTLRWAAGNSQDISPRMTAFASGVLATLDTNGNDVAFASPLTGAGNLIKAGSGNLSLSANNTYTGTTSISAGVLLITGSGRLGGGNYTGTISNNGSLSIASSANQTLGGSISGSGSLTKTGSGNLTLTNTSSSYSGGTTLNGGVLEFANNSLGTVGNITFAGNSTLRWRAGNTQDLSARLVPIGANITATLDTIANNVTFASALTGQGGITKAGSGTLTLSANNTYGGGTLITAGGLTLSGDGTLGSGPVTNAGSGNLNLGGKSLTNTLGPLTGGGSITNGTLTNDSGTYDVQNGTISSVLAGTNSLTKSTAGTVVLSGNNTYSGGTFISGGALQFSPNSLGASGDITFTGNATLSWTIGNPQDVSSRIAPIGANITATFSSSNVTFATPLTGAGSARYNGIFILTANNTYSGGTFLNSGTLQFSDGAFGTTGNITFANSATLRWAPGNTQDISSRLAPLGSGVTATLDTNGNDVTLAAAITGQGGIGKSGNGTLTLTANNTYSGGTTLNAGTLEFASSANQTLSGVILGAGRLSKSGSGTLTLSNSSNTYSGGTTLNAGTLEFASGGLGSGNITLTDNATLRWAAGNSLDISTRFAPLGANITTTIDTVDNSVSFASVISGQGNFAKTGNGFLALSGNNTYTGNTTIAQGTLALAGTGRLGGGIYAGAILNNGTFSPQGSANQTLSGVVSGTGVINKLGTSVLTLTAANTFSGNISVIQGTLALTGNGTLGASANYTGNIANNGALVFASSANQTLSGVVSGAGTLTKSGASVLTLTANNTLFGNITISAGTLALDGAGRLDGGNYSGVVSNNGTFAFASSANQTLSGVISGSGVLSKAGAGVLTLSANNTYSGGTIISAGTLALTGNGTLGSGPVTSSGGIIDLGGKTLSNPLGALSGGGQIINGNFINNSGTYDMQSGTASTVLSGSNVLNKTGPGTVTLTNTNTYSGNTTIAAGTLALGASGTFANSPVINLGTSGSQGTLDLTAKAASFTFGANQTVSGYGTINIGTGKTVFLNGILAPGNSPGITSVAGNLTFAPTTDTFMEIVGLGGVAGTDFDQVSVTGTLTFDGDLFINLGSLTGLSAGDSFFLFNAGSYTPGLDTVSVSSTAYTLGSLVGTLGVWSVTDAVSNLTFTFTEANGRLTVTAIPEPSTAAFLAGLGVIGLTLRRRRRARV